MTDWKAVVEEFVRAVSCSKCETLLDAFSLPTIDAIYASLANKELNHFQ